MESLCAMYLLSVTGSVEHGHRKSTTETVMTTVTMSGKTATILFLSSSAGACKIDQAISRVNVPT
eukprot:9646333-Lingulodinium_polyedra.AAC.1